jgi:hypothetical protein
LKIEHCVYGLRLSADVVIPGLEPIANPERCDLDIRLLPDTDAVFEDRRFSRDLFYTESPNSGAELPTLSVWRSASGDSFRFAYQDGTEFVLDRTDRRIWSRWPAPSTLEDAATYLLGPILGYWLRLQGVTCLHASAIAVDGRAIALVGPHHAGKSTTAAAFARRGYPILSEDVVALRQQEGAFMVSPGYPLLRLWPASVRHLFGRAEALPRLTPNWDKCYLDLRAGVDRFQRDPLPLAAIYLLGDRRADPAAPAVEAVTSASRLMMLVANTYANYLLDEPSRAQEFQTLGRLIARVPVRRVIPHVDPAFLPRLCDVILDDCRSLDSWRSLEICSCYGVE